MACAWITKVCGWCHIFSSNIYDNFCSQSLVYLKLILPMWNVSFCRSSQPDGLVFCLTIDSRNIQVCFEASAINCASGLEQRRLLMWCPLLLLRSAQVALSSALGSHQVFNSANEGAPLSLIWTFACLAFTQHILCDRLYTCTEVKLWVFELGTASNLYFLFVTKHSTTLHSLGFAATDSVR